MTITAGSYSFGRRRRRSAAAWYGAGTRLVRAQRRGKDSPQSQHIVPVCILAHHHTKEKLIVFIKTVKFLMKRGTARAVLQGSSRMVEING